MPVRVIQGNAKVSDQVDRIAIQRGPIVYCMEQSDNPGLDLDKIIFPNSPKFGLRLQSDPLGVMMRLSVRARLVNPDGSEKYVDVEFIPYYAWANREPGRMMVWLPTKAEQLPKPLPGTLSN